MPYNNTYNDDFKVSGWALNSSGVKSVSILVDGNIKGYALTGLSRPDKKGSYPNYPNADTSGFDYTLGIWELSNGAHTVTAIATGNDGSTARHAVDFTVNKSNTGSIDMQISITKSFCAGFVDAIAENFLGLYKMISSPIQTLVTLDFLVKAAKDISSPEGQQLIKIVGSELEDIANQFKNGDANVRARLVGRAVGEIFIFFIGPKGITKTLEILGNYAKYNKLGELVISKAGGAAAIIEGAAEAVSKLKFTLKYSINELSFQIKKVVSIGDNPVVVLDGGFKYAINTAEDVPELFRPQFKEVIENIWKYSGKTADEIIAAGKQIIPSKGYNTFKELKDTLGLPGDESQWHHIVEQSQIKDTRAGFATTDVNNLNNIVSLPSGSGSIHAQVSGYYSSIQDFTSGLTVRDWLATKSFDEQFKFGVEYLQRFGNLIPTSKGWVFNPF
ncbi:hypothetical protein CSC2_26700 [Clostridium zeae]|uniref:Uncharacterized protein n=1 Tax=Clostridium zeae TaxID=2759022 RepID=A0ABQ1EBW1_9CLOT|nr:Ig-like domain-containing protein [Clostridium zeae]GFZ32144.1 hypothetical protein CSC2_26700 [Clostridium zeae]